MTDDSIAADARAGRGAFPLAGDPPPSSDPAPTRADAPAVLLPSASVVVCSSCRGPDGSDARPRPGERLALAARDIAARHMAGGAVDIREAECLGNCKRRLSAAVLAPGAWTYVFGDLTHENAADLVEGARLLAAAPDGIMPWRGRPDCLKRGLVSRVPPLSPRNPS